MMRFLPLAAYRATRRRDGLSLLQFDWGSLRNSIIASRSTSPSREIAIMADLESYVAFSLANVVLAPLREAYPRTFLLSRLQVTLRGIDYGADVGSVWMDALVPLLETLPHQGVPIVYCQTPDLRIQGLTSILVNLEGHHLSDFLPLLVESTPLLDPNAFLFLPSDWNLARVVEASNRAVTKEEFELSLLNEGGGIYRWVEHWFELLLRSDDIPGLGYNELNTLELPEATTDHPKDRRP